MTIASTMFSIDAGTRLKVGVYLNAAGQHLLNARHGHLSASIELEQGLGYRQATNILLLGSRCGFAMAKHLETAGHAERPVCSPA